MTANPQRLAEARSIAYHAEVARLVRSAPSVLQAARARVAAWVESGSVARVYAEPWANLLDGPLEELLAFLVDPGQRARDLRQVSPFAGAIDARTRWRIHRDVGAGAGR